MSTPAIACETGNSLTVASFAQPPSQVLGATAPRRKRKDGSSAPASGAGVGPNGGCPCPNVSVLVAAAAIPPAAAAPSMSRRENSVIRSSSDQAPRVDQRRERSHSFRYQVNQARHDRGAGVFCLGAHRPPSTGGPMTTITLDQADRLIDAILKRGAELDCRPLSVIVVEPGCKVKAFKKEDGSSMIRFEMAYGKAYAALAMGRSSKLVKVRAEEKPIFMRYLLSASGDQIFPEGGGLQIRDAAGEVIGAVGVTGDTEDRDEELAAQGIRAIGLKTDEDCAELGRRTGIRLTNK